MKTSASLGWHRLVVLFAAAPLFFAGGVWAFSFDLPLKYSLDPSVAGNILVSAEVQPEAPDPAALAEKDAQAGGELAKDEQAEEAHASAVSGAKLKDLFWRFLNFVALVIILVKFAGKPVMTALSGRQQRIAGELHELTAKRDEAERVYHEFTNKLAEMEQEIARVASQAAAQAEAERARILAEARRAAEDIKRQAGAAVRGEVEDAKRQLREEIAEEAAKMAEELIKKNLTGADQAYITKQYLERVGAAL